MFVYFRVWSSSAFCLCISYVKPLTPEISLFDNIRGLYVDEHLKWNDYVNVVIGKISGTCRIL